MPEYNYRCRLCGAEQSLVMTIDQYTNMVVPPFCPTCNEPMVRRYFKPATPTTFQPGFNMSLGRYIGSERELRSAFNQLSEEATRRTGIEHNYQPHDPRDTDFAQANGVNEKGLDATAARKRQMGLTDRKTFG